MCWLKSIVQHIMVHYIYIYIFIQMMSKSVPAGTYGSQSVNSLSYLYIFGMGRQGLKF